MLSLSRDRYSKTEGIRIKYWIIVGLLLITLAVSLQFDAPWLLPIIGSLCLAMYFIVYNPRLVLGLTFLLIPLSAELELPGGLATDFPGEPLLWSLFGLGLLTMFYYGIKRELWHILTSLVVLQLLWMLVALLFATNSAISIKFFIAKLWYVVPFLLLPAYLLRNKIDINRILDLFVIGTLIGGVYFFINHFATGLDYDTRVTAGKPIWRNHVNYACTLTCALPIVWYRLQQSRKFLFIIVTGLLLLCIYFAYARIAYICMISALGYLIILKYKLTFPAIIVIIVTVFTITFQTISDENYIKYAPVQEKAISQRDFSSKVETTFNRQDISTMERVHRWVAGVRMIQERPWSGFGPSNFYSTYRPYTVYSFETYVSDNPEKSGIHNYYLMTLVEQGWIGLLILVSILITALIKLESIYYKLTDPDLRRLVIMVGMILIMIITINLINDMIEVIKIGSLYFFSLFIIIRLDAISKKGAF